MRHLERMLAIVVGIASAASCAKANGVGSSESSGTTGAGGSGGSSTATSTATAGGGGSTSSTGGGGPGGGAATSTASASSASSASNASSGGAGGGGGSGNLCGDGMIEAGEQCDGADFGGLTCVALGYTTGTIACTSSCSLDKSDCSACHDGKIQPQFGEDCDFDAMNNPLILASCQSLGFMSPNNPGCDAGCHYDTTPCLCGDGMIDGAEACDGADLGGKTCATQGFSGGVLACSPKCGLDTSGCTKCGDGIVDPGEACDGMSLGGKTCQTQGFTAGTLSCNAQCGLVTSGCTKCGNGVLEAGEQCDDGNNLAGDGCGATCLFELPPVCDPDGNYAIIVGGPASYTCCGGLIGVNVTGFILSGDGASIVSTPSNPVTMTGAGATCPSGSFSATGSIPGGCTETYSVAGTYTDKDTWTGTYTLTFTGSQCDCFGGLLGTPCINQVFPITAMR